MRADAWFNRGGGAGRAVVFSCYFNKKVDPQRGQFLADDNFKYIEKWYLSVVEKDLYAVIFHDGLSSEFLRKYSTMKITFHHVALGERSTNDERFFFYYKYLSEHPEITAVVMTDISDVVIQNDPFEFMMLTGDYIYAGRDYGNKMEDNGWLTPRERVCFVKGFDKEEHRLIKKKSQVYNAGVVGGYTDTMIEFLGEMTYYLSLCPIKFNCNMPVYNFVLHRSFETRIFSGFPWNSRFFMKEKDPLGVYIIHK
ncbi:hypothetical protein SARC_03505 [Sphaeroforma arctica JP610]|uniref:DUF5672 domain-containing protein n=1 Tax=Sphaeroforma arctica JP610 TaxID=667725 RepID=A0A0L0G5Q1_9EUKA|nr:hypothetical protein SARC_03505 [Sphaeroforma arctica JP610]KNC84279.1 hypothetical protein SARC_03505 [Sphaeroforma arctica JP610]|eukprot:XP_014158181.1 hypothetical protein SARC_03505 [Sphaeroforma arctica JP610]